MFVFTCLPLPLQSVFEQANKNDDQTFDDTNKENTQTADQDDEYEDIDISDLKDYTLEI